MRKLLSVLIGLFLIVVATVIFWVARGPQATEATTTGGKLYSQQEIAASGTTALNTTTDQGLEIPLAPALSSQASADLQSLDSAEVESVQPSAIEADTQIEVAPIAVSGTDLAAPGGQGGMGSIVEGEYEQRVVELEWPAKFQVGRSGSLRVKLKVLDSGALQPVAEIADNEIIATPILITNRYATHNAFVTLNLSAPDFDFETTSPVTQQMFPGSEVEWRYTLEADDAQTSVISLSLTISWISNSGGANGPQDVVIWGQGLQVEVVYVFGLISVPQASIAGTVLGLVGLVAQFPLLEKFLEIFIDALFGRDRKDDRRQQQRRRNRRNRRNDDRRNRRR
jgi:hypothetical protein